jgi:MFS family permease
MTPDGEGVVPASTIVGIALASALVPLNSTMIAVALPDIGDHFDITTRQASVLVTLYLVAMLVVQPLSGRAVDALGARRLARIATAGFGIFSAAAMVAGSFWLVVVLRALQAAFAAALIPSVQAMLRELIPAAQRGRAFGVQGSVIGVGAGLGPVIGGLAVAAFGWRAIFGVNLPVVLAVLYVLERRVARAPVPAAAHAAVEAGSVEPLFNRAFGAAFATQALATLAQYGLLLAIPIVLDERGWSAAGVGMSLSFLTVGLVVTGPYGGHLGDAWGRRRPVLIGLAVALAAVVASAASGDGAASVVLIATLLVFGVGFGVAAPSIMTAGIEAAPLSRTGSASGVLSASRYVGSITSTLVLAAVVADDGSGLSAMLAICALSLVLSLVAAGALPSEPGVRELVDLPAQAAGAVDPPDERPVR